MESLFVILLFLTIINLGSPLECYVCDKQDSNKGKCTKTIMTCKQEEDMCLTEIKWGTTPYWQAGAQKQYYISKKCATKQVCQRTMKKFMPYCTHVWYEDWKCSECCAGERCNFYIISGSPKFDSNILLLSISALFIGKLSI